MAPPTASSLLSDTMQRCRERAPGYDRDNHFFQEDFDELRQAGPSPCRASREAEA